MSLLNDLNPVQKKALLETEGPLLVFAGAGSGKTRVLTYRIAYLIQEKKVAPWNILAVTFTNKAADEMRERVERLLGRRAKGMWISTFHSACVRILRRHIECLGFGRNFVIYDDQDQERHLKAVMKELDLDFKVYHPRAVQSAIDHLKNQGVTPGEYIPAEFNIFQKRVGLIYERYQEDLRRNNALDFGDLLNFVVVLFKRFPDVLRHYQEQFHYILVDEFQDTNLIQYQLINQIGRKSRNICVVGDDDQSIYSWRGAEVGNILNFGKDFPDSKIITLEQNYRSTQNILDAANRMVSRNRRRKAKKLWTENRQGELLTFYSAEDEADEARFVVKKIMERCQASLPSNKFSEEPARIYRDIAVFYRINAQSRAIEEELVKNQLPYTIVGGMKFYERKEIKDILAYLKLIANPSDGLSLRRIINIPPRGIGERTLDKIEAVSKERGIPLYEGLRQVLEENKLPPLVHLKMKEFVDLIEELRKDVMTLTVSQLALAILARTGYLQRLKDERTDEAISRIENIEELVNVMMEFEGGAEEPSLGAFLDRASLVTDVDLWEDKGNRVSLMTLHCAKGLEFPVVYIIGVEDGLLPHYRRGDEIEDLEEERRLFYVGITRAKEKLFLSRAERRFTFGAGRANRPSRFLDDIPMELIEIEEREPEPESFFGDEWDEPFTTEEREALGKEDDHLEPYTVSVDLRPGGDFRPEEGIVFSPEGFFPLKTGMRVRHPKFGDGRVRAVEGMDEDQKATILFQTVGSKRLKVRYAQLEILE